MNDIEIATEAARRGGEILLRYWERLGRDDADLKARNDWVSRADRESEKAIVDYLTARCPADQILGEETGLTKSFQPSSGRTWVVDPLDGTSNYLQHFPIWSVSIGLRTEEQVIAGVVYEPLRNLFFKAQRGAGAFRNDSRIRVSNQQKVEGAFLATGFPFRAMQLVETYTVIFKDVTYVAKGIRRAGSAALDLAYTAAGVFDGFFEMALAPWDVAAGSLLVTEAGGVVSDFSGGESWWSVGNIVGATPQVHRELLQIVKRHTSEDHLASLTEGRTT